MEIQIKDLGSEHERRPGLAGALRRRDPHVAPQVVVRRIPAVRSHRRPAGPVLYLLPARVTHLRLPIGLPKKLKFRLNLFFFWKKKKEMTKRMPPVIVLIYRESHSGESLDESKGKRTRGVVEMPSERWNLRRLPLNGAGERKEEGGDEAKAFLKRRRNGRWWRGEKTRGGQKRIGCGGPHGLGWLACLEGCMEMPAGLGPCGNVFMWPKYPSAFPGNRFLRQACRRTKVGTRI